MEKIIWTIMHTTDLQVFWNKTNNYEMAIYKM